MVDVDQRRETLWASTRVVFYVYVSIVEVLNVYVHAVLNVVLSTMQCMHVTTVGVDVLVERSYVTHT